MKSYIVYAIDPDGNKVVDLFKRENIEELHVILDRNSYTPLKIYTLPSYLSYLSVLFEARVKPEHIIEILDNMNLSLRAGIPLNDSLHDIAQDATNKELRKIVTRIANDVTGGEKLSTACEPYEKYFTKTIINLMKIGEETGNISTTLANGSEFLKKTQSLKSNIKKAMIHPLLSIGMMFLAVAAWMTMVVPGLVGFFEDMDVELPALTKFLIATSKFLENYLGTMVLAIIASIILFKYIYKRNGQFRRAILLFLFKLPIIADVLKLYNISYIAEYLQLSVASGVTLYESNILLTEVIENDLYKDSIVDAVAQLRTGRSFSQALSNNPLYTRFTIRLLSIGEETGSMERELETIATTYFKKVDDFSEAIPKIIQPLVLAIGGGMMATIMLGLMGPIYELIGNI